MRGAQHLGGERGQARGRGRGRGRAGQRQGRGVRGGDALQALLDQAPNTELDFFYPAEIVQERFLRGERQYLLVWIDSVTSKHSQKKTKARIAEVKQSSSDGKYALVSWKEWWENAGVWDTDSAQAQIVQEWRRYCGAQQIQTPLTDDDGKDSDKESVKPKPASLRRSLRRATKRAQDKQKVDGEDGSAGRGRGRGRGRRQGQDDSSSGSDVVLETDTEEAEVMLKKGGSHKQSTLQRVFLDSDESSDHEDLSNEERDTPNGEEDAADSPPPLKLVKATLFKMLDPGRPMLTRSLYPLPSPCFVCSQQVISAANNCS